MVYVKIYNQIIFKHRNIQRPFLIPFSKYCQIQTQDEDINLIEKDKDYEILANKYLNITSEHGCFIIHPYVKWGPNKVKTALQYQIIEAVALINSLQAWKVIDKIVVPLDNLQKKTLFGKGSLAKLTQKIRVNPAITSVFINIGTLKIIQLKELENHFKVPIFDRYSIVMQIFRCHAISKHAKLQVALAELPYLCSRLKEHDPDLVANSKIDTPNLIQSREKKIKEAIKNLKSQRELLRQKRIKINFPIVAVVGYTNVGKTSLIKVLTGDKSLVPRNQLFATLDVTFHAGFLPSGIKILYVDTVGFLSDIPTGLIECFNATLEDAILADVILYVEDLSSLDILYQRMHVMTTLKNISENIGINNIKKKIITVGNKSDVYKDNGETILKVSTITEVGIDLLRQKIEDKILEMTKRRKVRISVPTGGDEIRWLYKNATVLNVEEDENNNQNNIVRIIITEAKLHQFKHNFVS